MKDNWTEDALTFLGKNTLIFAFFTTLIVFLNQYLPMGATLLEKVKGHKIIIVLPVVATLAFNFFALTFLVAAGSLLALFFALFFGSAVLVHLLLKTSETKDKLFETVKASFYSSRVILFMLVPILFLYPVKKGIFTFSVFMLIYCIAYLCSTVSFYWLLNLAAARNYPGKKSWLITAVPILIITIAGLFFALKFLPKMAPLIS
ncbi:hypothetical protein A2276_02550 [candidate division WOR-1 bacterium RIFOXYA12_FULL_43_27]|uniref:Yip1 domain-containing protein n=1 Tax=candidate division WOR-1 bacterium RIFOXYC2_FULL_46_14 TaxID=1802587 RepID=A0A1F4U7X2_UNCSA|nr:MAG: hypothetical protein A2276_02550 [candidate division WOR-1 bacterium RIFOXYA12_FULL_43_27]OGC19408.1 MAG: hypothetical protein A2292_01780 [candidate division WOR-1 bacterium RIFOXYB2_FULL_46_45]OGC30397.1 MAG: hypothetical protein A2232_01780 [candidate division WOR-1 bacterium RIFOXYA2_FULL_46_56]OGC40997.1 MAG: hypothetical protein A2438_01780 [candidate division WOR-1 bacterium RIFOXYC2_FULL_46_14]